MQLASIAKDLQDAGATTLEDLLAEHAQLRANLEDLQRLLELEQIGSIEEFRAAVTRWQTEIDHLKQCLIEMEGA